MSRRHHQANPTRALSESQPPSMPYSQVNFSWEAWAQRLVIMLFHLLVLTVPFIFTWVNEELFEFNKMMLTYGFVIAIAAAWLGRMILAQRLIFRRTPFDWVVAAFVASQLISTLLSIHPRTSWLGYYTRFHGGFLSTLSYVLLLYAFASNFEKRHLKIFFVSVLLAATGVALYAVPEHFGFSPSCWLIYSADATPHPADPASNYWVSCWIQNVQDRVFATFGQPNWLAAYLITLIPLALSLLTVSYHNLKKLGLVLVIWLLWMTLLFTQSRSGFLGLAVGLAGWLACAALYGFWEVTNRSPQNKLALAWVALVLVGCLGLTVWFGSPFTPSWQKLGLSLIPVAQPATPINQPATPLAQPATPLDKPATPSVPIADRLEIGGTDSGEIRKIVWTGAVAVWHRYFWLGSGVETFAYSYYQDRPLAHNLVSEWDFLYNKAHNEFLNFLATTGVVGLGTYLALLGWFGVWTLWQMYVIFQKKSQVVPATQSPATAPTTQADNTTTTYFWLIGLWWGVIALSISNFFGFSTVMVSVLLFLYLGIASVLTADESYSNPPSPASLTTSSLASPSLTKNSLTFSQATLLILVVLSSSLLFMQVGLWWYADHLYTQGKAALNAGEYALGIPSLSQAITLSPNEALFHDEMALGYARLAIDWAISGNATNSAQAAQAAVTSSNNALLLNDRHLNFYKTRSRIFIILAQLNPALLEEAQRTLEQALLLAPTDAKLMYNLALIQLERKTPTAEATLLKSIEMKPNYETARDQLAQYYAAVGKYELANTQYEYILAKINPDNAGVKQRWSELQASLSATKRQQPTTGQKL